MNNKKTKEKVNYVEPEDFHNEYIKSEINGEPTYELFLMFEKIAKKYSSIWNSKNKTDTDACINYATYEAIRKWKKYNKHRSENIFAFFTQMIKNDLMTHYNKICGKKNTISIEALFSGIKDF